MRCRMTLLRLLANEAATINNKPAVQKFTLIVQFWPIFAIRLLKA